MRRVVTQDETWVHHFDPEAKKQGMQWKHPGSPLLRNLRVSSAGKVMTSMFLGSQVVIMVDYLEEGRTINDAYYAETVRQPRGEIMKKRRGKLTQDVLLLQDNVPAHTSPVAMAAVTKCGFEVLRHPRFSSDGALSDFCLFSNLKNSLRCRIFEAMKTSTICC